MLVKLYGWEELTCLALKDLCIRQNLSMPVSGRVHSVAGLDSNGQPFIRLDLNPLSASQATQEPSA